MNRPKYRSSYADDPGLLTRVFYLLDRSFPGLSARVRALEPYGLRWDQLSTPFLLSSGHQVLAHVGVLEMPMVVDGREVTVGGIHAVCTDPDHRRRGYFRSVLNEALAWCDRRYATVILMAARPEIYRPFGFRVVRETRFVAPECRRARTPARPELRRLELDKQDDLNLLHQLLDKRAPVSRRLGVLRERGVFVFNQATEPLWYAEGLDAVLCVQLTEATLRVYDLVATETPPLQKVIDCIASPFTRVEVYFTPDCLDASLLPEPHVVDGDGWLMARGELTGWQGDLMLPRSARF